jgi:anti-sigma B factor antagonist
MSLELQQDEVEGIIILILRGRLVAGEAVNALRDEIAKIVQGVNTQDENQTNGAKNVILNLKHVTYIDSSGLGALIASHSTIRHNGGDLRLLQLSKRSAQLLILTKLTTVFQIFDDEEAAINSFFAGREVKPFDILEFVKSQELVTDDDKEIEPA